RERAVEDHRTPAGEDAAEDILAEVVGPEPERAGRRRVRDARLSARRGGREVRPDERDAEHERNDRQADAHRPRTGEGEPTRDGPRECERAHPAVLSFGISMTTTTSAAMLITM